MYCDELASSTYKMSKENFFNGAKVASEALSKARRVPIPNEEDGSYLHTWILNDPPGFKHFRNHSGESLRYLVHPPVTSWTKTSSDHQLYRDNTIYESSITPALDGSSSLKSGDEEDSDNYGNDEFPLDDSIAQIAQCSMKDSSSSCNMRQIEWSFSVVYSHVWGVPVLYFRVQYLNGIPLSRSQVLNILIGGIGDSIENKGTHEDAIEEDDGWNFVSYEEHPITGVPSFFLHPCQTSKRLHLLMIATGAENDEYSVVKKNPANVLLSWLSMILPSTGFRMSPKVFCAARKEIVLMNTVVDSFTEL